MVPAKTCHELLRQAVEDAQILEKTPGYTLEMRSWYTHRDGTCLVCLAGAWMVRHAEEMDLSADSLPGVAMLPPGLSNYTHVIDAMRSGDFARALWRLRSPGHGTMTMEQAAVCVDASDLITMAWQSRLARADWTIYLQAADLLATVNL